MVLEDFLNQLQDPDPHKRIQALQILAMVEETRAVNAVLAVYKQDPDPQVREVAKWAGSLIWRAQQGGHNTEADMHRFFEGDRKAYVADSLVDSLSMSVAPKDKAAHEEAMVRMTRDHAETLSSRHGKVYGAAPVKTDTQVMNDLSQNWQADDLDLLDAGLRDL